MKPKIWIGAAIILLVFTVSAFGQTCDPNGKLLLACTKRGAKPCVPSRHSETDNWCWSATAQMIMEYWGTAVDQCWQADEYYTEGRNGQSCCSSSIPSPGVCDDRGGWPRFAKYGFNSNPWDGGNETDVKTNGFPPQDRIYTILDWEQLTQQICGVGPFATSWYADDDAGGRLGHMVVVTGYRTRKSGVQEVQIIDSCVSRNGGCQTACCSEKRMISYDDYIDGGGIHWVDYTDIKR